MVPLYTTLTVQTRQLNQSRSLIVSPRCRSVRSCRTTSIPLRPGATWWVYTLMRLVISTLRSSFTTLRSVKPCHLRATLPASPICPWQKATTLIRMAYSASVRRKLQSKFRDFTSLKSEIQLQALLNLKSIPSFRWHQMLQVTSQSWCNPHQNMDWSSSSPSSDTSTCTKLLKLP